MEKPRARQLNIILEGTPGKYNAITDVDGVTVGHATLIQGEGGLITGMGPVRTGVTAIRPRGDSISPVFGAWHTLNGCGEMTGTTWLEESGILYGPVMITNTHSVGVVRDTVAGWIHEKYHILFGLPVVAETYDGFLNDINGFHVKAEHAIQALEHARSGDVPEGNVGGGTGMICHGFKGGIGTASRVIDPEHGGYTVGVLVQANHGSRRSLTIAGVPVGKEIPDMLPLIHSTTEQSKSSSIIAVAATDCPLLPHQLKRLAKRIPLGIGKLGGMGENWSGDIFLAFSTAEVAEPGEDGLRAVSMLTDERINPLFAAIVQATEEAILNALLAAETMQGINENTVHALPHDRLIEVLKSYQRV
jgi:L-aminopeptidase/D-esterase-like protein